MGSKKHTAEEIIGKLRQAEMLGFSTAVIVGKRAAALAVAAPG